MKTSPPPQQQQQQPQPQQPNGVAPPPPQPQPQQPQQPQHPHQQPHVNAHARPYQPHHHYPPQHHHPQHPYAHPQYPTHPQHGDGMGPPRGAPHFEYRQKGGMPQQQPDFQEQMNLPDGAGAGGSGSADAPPQPFKQGAPMQSHPRPYGGSAFVPGGHNGGGYQYRPRGPPRGGMPPPQNFMPRGPHMNQHAPRGQPPHMPPYMQQQYHHPGAYGMPPPPGVPGGPPFMPPPGPMSGGYPGGGPGMGGMPGMPPMNHMPPPHAHTAHAAPPPQQREKKVLSIIDPVTGKPITFKGAAKTETPTKPVVDAVPSPVLKPAAAGDSAQPVADATPKPSKAAAKKAAAAKASGSVNAGEELLAKVRAMMEAGKSKTPSTAAPSAAPVATESAVKAKAAPVTAPVAAKPATPATASPKKTTTTTDKKPEPVAPPAVTAPVKKPEPAAAKKPEPAVASPVKKPEPVVVAAAKKPEPTAVASPKKAPASPTKAPQSPKKTAAPAATPAVVSSPVQTKAKSPAVSPKKKVEQPKPTIESAKDQVNTVAVTENGKFTYSLEALLRFRELYTELPEDAKEGAAKWPTMEVVSDGAVRVRGGRSGSGRGGRGAGAGGEGGENWEKPGLNRQSSRASSGGGGGGSSWQRSQDLPKRESSDRGGRGGRGGGGGRGGRGGRGGQQEPLFDGPVKPLERTDNRWIPVKAVSNVEAAKKKVQSIMNKMTREKFDKLAAQITEINMDSLEMLQSVIRLLFDKALGEPHFCDMYADLCVHLEKHWQVWSFLKIVQNDDDKKFYWTTMAESDSEVVGPFASQSEALDACGSDEFEPIAAPETMKLHEVRIRDGKFVKVWVNETADQAHEFFWSGQLLEDLVENEQILNGPYDSPDLANRYAIKSCSFKRILLNACQEEFEKDNIYEELEENFKKDKEAGNLTAEAIAEYEEKRIIMKARMLGNIRFIGELYRKGMLQERIMHECISKLMGVKSTKDGLEPSHPGNAPDEESIESLVKLLSTMGKDLERSNASAMGVYFGYLEKKLVKDKRLSSRITFMIQDVSEMRNNNWQPRRKELQSKSLNEIRKEAEREAQREAQQSQQSHHRGPPASAPGGGGGDRGGGRHGDSFRRSNSSRDGGNFSQPRSATTAHVYSQSQSMNSRSSGANKMVLPSRGVPRDESIKTGRPASFGASARAPPRGPPVSAGPVLQGQGRQQSGPAGGRGGNGGNGRGGSGPTTPKHKDAAARGSPAAAATVAKLSEDDKETIEKKAKSLAEEYVSIVDLTEATACYAEILKQFKSHADVPGVVASGVLKLAIEAKADTQRKMFDLLEKLSVEKAALSFDGIRTGIQETLAFGNDLWCDVPKLHENLADFIARFAKISDKSGVTLDWLLGTCLQSLDPEMYDEIIDGGFLAEVCGCLLKSLAATDAAMASRHVRSTHVTLLSLFPDFKQTTADFKKWIDKHAIGESLALQPAVEFAEHWTKSKDLEETVNWYGRAVPESVKKDTVFASLACVLVLNSVAKGALPSDDEGMLLTGLCVSGESQTRLVAALIQTRGANTDDASAFKALLKHLVKEQHSIPGAALTRWLELKNDSSVGRKRALAALGGVVEELAKTK